ncbi:MAG: hypothetical protein O9325_07780 [Roseomonas sp.]|nr:hypothetical protein [Roseomonas sp.]
MAWPSLAFALLLLLGGCAERWVRPGTTEAQADATLEACQDRAAVAVQPLMVWQIVDPGGYVRERRCWINHSGREVCGFTERWRPPRYGWVDANSGPREAWRRGCMRSQGFTFEGYRPLRLFGDADAAQPVDAPPP